MLICISYVIQAMHKVNYVHYVLSTDKDKNKNMDTEDYKLNDRAQLDEI